MKKIPIIAVVGATASGKTGLAIEIAERFNGEIVSADSMQIYKYMNIGTAKPTADERKRAVHHLIDYVDPREGYSAADYAEAAHECIADIVNRAKTPILCGGTGLYINSVVDDVRFAETERDAEYRASLFKTAEEKGNAYLHALLEAVDPESAANIHENNVKRVVRAMEFYNQTGMKLSDHKVAAVFNESRYNPTMLGIKWDRERLYERINRRVDIMLSHGLYDEVKSLYDMGLTADTQSMQGIGYKEMLSCVDGKISLEEAADEIKRSSRRYAKRQMTWFKRDSRIHWIDGGGDVFAEAAEILRSDGYGC